MDYKIISQFRQLLTYHHPIKRGSYLLLTFTCVLLSGFLSFSNSFNGIYLQNSSTLLGNTDVLIIRGNPTQFYDFHFESNLKYELESILPDTLFFPRLYTLANSEIFNPLYFEQGQNLVLCGINSSLENYAQKMYLEQNRDYPTLLQLLDPSEKSNRANPFGSLLLCNDSSTVTSQYFEDEIPFGKCLLTRTMALGLNASVGQHISFKMVTGVQYLTVLAIVENIGRLPNIDSGLIITDLKWVQSVLNIPGYVNALHGIFTSPDKIYNLRDLQTTATNLNRLTQHVLDKTGNDFVIVYPRLMNLQMNASEILELYMVLDILLVFIAVLLFCILIMISNATRDSCEKIIPDLSLQPYPLRTLSIHIFLYLGYIFAIPSMSGLVGGLIVSYFIFGINFSLDTIQVAISILLCLFIMTWIKYIFDIKNSAKTIDLLRKTVISHDPIHRIHSIKKNVFLVAIGFICTIVSLGSLIALPSLLMNPNPMIIELFLGILAFTLFFGLILIAYVSIPYIEQAICTLLMKIRHIHKKRPQNVEILSDCVPAHSNVTIFISLILFSFSFCLVGFQQLKNVNLINQIQYEQGADMIICNQGGISDHTSLNQTFLEFIRTNDVVEHASPIYYSFSNRLSPEHLFSSNSFDLAELNSFTSNPGSKFNVIVGDLGDWQTLNAGLIGVSADFFEVIESDMIYWESNTNRNISAINELFENASNFSEAEHKINCIISHQIADRIYVSELNTKIILNVYSSVSNQLLNQTLLNVVGISSGIPGFSNFYTSNPFSNPLGGIIVSEENYFAILGISKANQNQIPIDEIFIDFSIPDLSPNTLSPTILIQNQFVENLSLTFQDQYQYQIIEPISKIQILLNGNERFDQYFIYFHWGAIISTLILTNQVNNKFRKKNFTKNNLAFKFISPLVTLCISGLIGFLYISAIFFIIAQTVQIPIRFLFDYVTIFKYASIFFLCVFFGDSLKSNL